LDELVQGAVAPNFTVQSSGGKTVSLSDFRGRNVILYFYPKDDTPGCTKEACQFRDLFPDFSSADAVVLGISPDDVTSHDKFAARYNLPFTLLADPGHAVAGAYGAWKERTSFGTKRMGIERSTFLIGGDGTIKKIWRNVRADGHASSVLKALAA
jgi:thioredoxin-dependent peroxiredoxin